MDSISSRPRVEFVTFGCRVNQYETQMMREKLTFDFDVDPASVSTVADVYVVNACTVTALAERKARQAIRRLRRQSPQAKIIVIGCVGDAVVQGVSTLDEVDLVAANAWKTRIKEVIARALAHESGVLPVTPPQEMDRERISYQAGRARAFLKIQDGCDRACTFCRTTQVRGSSRSKPIDATVDEAIGLIENGYPEIVLTGINLAQYGSETDTLATLTHKLLRIERLRRLRLASINPYGIDDRLIDVFASDSRACSHFHIPLQSGDDRVLRLMARGYTSTFFLSRVDQVRRAIPDATFGADIIVGFPGEDDESFAKTLDMIERVTFANLHVFRYSPRAGTQAANARDRTPEGVKRERAEQVAERFHAVQRTLLETYVGESMDILLEEPIPGGWRGYTRGYIDTHVHTAAPYHPGEEIAAIIVGARNGRLQGVTQHRTGKCGDQAA